MTSVQNAGLGFGKIIVARFESVRIILDVPVIFFSSALEGILNFSSIAFNGVVG